ncbi:MAG: sulfatase-like hydrolase/transferase [Bacteroidia bacterium]|nr:sulfatase-like hydrolase/transferase [Bacteroidia bacterium]
MSKIYFSFLFIALSWVNLLPGQNNFVVILADDLGWTGTSVQMLANDPATKSDFYYTPNLEALAQDGMIFPQAYAPAPKCAPTRASLLTGKTTARTKTTTTGNGLTTGELLVPASNDSEIKTADTTFAEWLKNTGLNYRTAHYGKWHLSNGGPNAHGFDDSDGSTSNGDGDTGSTVAQSDPKRIFELTNKAINFIQTAKNDGVPFYVQLSHYAVHTGIEAQQATIDLYNDPSSRAAGSTHTNPEYAAMTEDLDTGIGMLLQELTNLGLDGNTYVIFTSDNGASAGQSSNTPLSRGKTFIFEGGIRVPFIIKGPNIPADSRNDEAIVLYDLFPTLASLSGSTQALPALTDGKDFSASLLGGTPNPAKPIYFHSPHYENNPAKTPRSTIVEGDYKMIAEYETGNFYLYDLANDISESNDLSASLPANEYDLRVKLRNHLRDVGARMPSLDPSHPNFSGTGNDVDDDGLDDSWEFINLLTYTYGPNDDPDNDGISNIDEFNNGSDPYSLTTSINELLSHDAILVYPNPAKDLLKLDVGENESKFLFYRLLDLQGRTLLNGEQFTSEISVAGLIPGHYMLQMGFEGGQVYRMVVVE